MPSATLESPVNHRRAGRQLARRLEHFTDRGPFVVLALPNGGVVLGAELAEHLKAPFDILLVRPITSPDHGDAVLGAITGGGVRLLDHAMIDRLQLSDADLRAAILREAIEIASRERFFRGGLPSLEVADQTVILVADDSMPCDAICQAIRLLKRQHVERVILAMPTASHRAVCELRLVANEVVTLVEPTLDGAIPRWLRRMPRLSDRDVRRITVAYHRFKGLARAGNGKATGPLGPAGRPNHNGSSLLHSGRSSRSPGPVGHRRRIRK